MISRALPGLFRGLVAGLAVFSLGCGVIERLTGPDNLTIQKFVPSVASAGPGERVTLSWEVSGAEGVEIDHGVGAVAGKGSVQVRPELTTVYTLSARRGTARATASVQVTVKTANDDTPFPSRPLPTPAPTPTPSPSPSITPGGKQPVPSPSPAPVERPSCGRAAAAAGNCGLTLVRGLLGGGECLELNEVAFDSDCPAPAQAPRKLRFTVTARTAKGLTWRRSTASGDVLMPPFGSLAAQGSTTVEVDDLALDERVAIEIADGARVLLTFAVRHR